MQTDRQTEGQTDMTKLIAAFRQFCEKRPKTRTHLKYINCCLGVLQVILIMDMDMVDMVDTGTDCTALTLITGGEDRALPLTLKVKEDKNKRKWKYVKFETPVLC
jgi:hypothetical protein